MKLKEFYFVGGIFQRKQFYLDDVELNLDKFAKGESSNIVFTWTHLYPTEWEDFDKSYVFSGKTEAQQACDEVRELHSHDDFEVIPITIATG